MSRVWVSTHVHRQIAIHVYILFWYYHSEKQVFLICICVNDYNDVYRIGMLGPLGFGGMGNIPQGETNTKVLDQSVDIKLQTISTKIVILKYALGNCGSTPRKI